MKLRSSPGKLCCSSRPIEPRVFDKLLIANRGEIAVRIIRAAKELGLRTVAAFSEADKESLAVRYADEAVCIGPAAASKSYLDANAIIAAARQSRAEAIHPGYGFLSENAGFAEDVAAAGLVFVGPAPDTIRMMGDKAAARAAAQVAGVPIVPGSEGEIVDLGHAVTVARQIGYPVMLKASAGGGGRGIRVASDEASLTHYFNIAQAEAAAAFGSGAIYLERFIEHARHIEVQVLGDGERVVHCFERECSLQRRRQKVWEEAPSPAIDEAIRKALCASAVRLAERAHYRGAGTLEYLYDENTGEFFFIEMNTRIQVEHPITEVITGIDLVREMIRIAQGERLRLSQADLTMRGAAIEVRINAEDPERDFRPSPGKVAALTLPGGPGVRVDTMLYPGYTVPAYYDSLLAKIIAHAETRELALARLRRALDEFAVEGIATTAGLHKRLARLDDVQAARFDTGFLERLLAAQVPST
jgi:acetyl-CoA carboxylase, biotin carboxylase subunit